MCDYLEVSPTVFNRFYSLVNVHWIEVLQHNSMHDYSMQFNAIGLTPRKRVYRIVTLDAQFPEIYLSPPYPGCIPSFKECGIIFH